MQGLKTGMYYLRSRPAVDAVKFTVDKLALKDSALNGQKQDDLNDQENRPMKKVETKPSKYAVPEDNGEGCLMCSG